MTVDFYCKDVFYYVRKSTLAKVTKTSKNSQSSKAIS